LTKRGFSAEVKIGGDVTGGVYALVEFVIDARRLVPPHIHISEDELSYVLEGEVGFRVGDEEYTVGPGHAVYKPRGIMHTFWNGSDRAARVLEFISPAGIEEFFVGRPTRPDRQPNVHSDEWVAGLKERYGLRLFGEG
jgi:uncharacterized cupin superfamily protein